MPQPYGAAQPIIDWAKARRDSILSMLGMGQPQQSQPVQAPADTSWHSGMVDAATNSFQRPEQAQQAPQRAAVKSAVRK